MIRFYLYGAQFLHNRICNFLLFVDVPCLILVRTGVIKQNVALTTFSVDCAVSVCVLHKLVSGTTPQLDLDTV